MTASIADELAYQERILPGVSRTFALTIPQLPSPLREVVANAYLLCRIADTIEDDAGLTPEQKRHFAEQFAAVVEGRDTSDGFAADLAPRLAPQTPAAERDLIHNSPQVIAVTRSFNANQRRALSRCVRIMAQGMAEYQERGSLGGLADLPAMGRYCYFVAGVVGEMLTELFCDYSPEIARHRPQLMPLAVSFGQGLQMTNILKDIWEDRQRGACWLPRDMFQAAGVNLRSLRPGSESQPGFEMVLGKLIGVTRGHLRNALTYTLYIPPTETGIRRFCLWAIGMAVLTLRRINRHRDFRRGDEVKISRRSVKGTIALANLSARNDTLLKALFHASAWGLPDSVNHETLSSLDCGTGTQSS